MVRRSPTYIALDAGSFFVGYAVMRDRVILDVGSWELPKDMPVLGRLNVLAAHIRQKLTDTLDKVSGEVICLCEIPNLSWRGMPTHPATTEALYGSGYILAIEALRIGIPTYTVDARSVKYILTGKFNASKELVQEALVMANITIPRRQEKRRKEMVDVIDEDAADAIALAYVVGEVGIQDERLNVRSTSAMVKNKEAKKDATSS